MSNRNFKYIYGPVPSWRLGSSLGIDPLSQESKICSYDCIYCQIGKTLAFTSKRKSYISIEDVLNEIEMLPDIKIDYFTFSGRGEPTLAENLGQMIKAIKTIRKTPVAVLTNSLLMDREDVRTDLSYADFVVAKLDACSKESFELINKPGSEIDFISMVRGIKQFRKEYLGKLALQIMLVKENKEYIKDIVYFANFIGPDEIQLNTPLRPCNVKPLSKEEVFNLKKEFSLLYESIDKKKTAKIVSVYDDNEHREVMPISNEDTLKRRGKI